MGTSLDTGQRASGPPSVKLRTIGDHLNFAVVDIDNAVPKTKYGTSEPDLKADGTPKYAVRVTALALGGQNPVRVENGVDVAVQNDEIVSIFIDSYSKWDPDNDKDDATHVSWGKAIDRFLGGDLQVGTVGQYAYLRDIPSQQAGNNPRKDRKFALRPATPDEASLVQRCEAARVELQSQRDSGATQLPTDSQQQAAQPAPANLGSF